jgi:hypothetical protein
MALHQYLAGGTLLVLKCVYPTEAKKLGVIAATYRSGDLSIYGTCPYYCSLLPKPKEGTQKIDWTYFGMEIKAVPRGGVAWSYTHFNYDEIPKTNHGTTINISTDTIEDAITAYRAGYQVAMASPTTDTQWPRRINGVRFIRCPAELHKHVTCQTCGGGQPLCARRNRDYVIVFVAHGTQKALVGQDKQGGCYASTGNCLWQWRRTLEMKGPNTWNETDDPERLSAWVRALPPNTLLRHRISGDLGISE